MEKRKYIKSLSTEELEILISESIGTKLNDKITSDIKVVDYNIDEKDSLWSTETKIVIHLKQRTDRSIECEVSDNNRANNQVKKVNEFL